MSNIKKARIAAGLSQKEIAISLGVAPPSVSNWERGERFPTGKNLTRLAELLNVTTDYILCKANKPPEEQKKEPTPAELAKIEIAEDYTKRFMELPADKQAVLIATLSALEK